MSQNRGVIYAISSAHRRAIVYVGQTNNLNRRFTNHRNQLRSGRHPNRGLRAICAVHGVEDLSVDVLEEAPLSDLTALEQRWTDELVAAGVRLVNMGDAGAVMRGRKHTEEARQKIIRAHTGRPCSPETRRKISEAQIGRVVSDSTRLAMSEAAKKRPPRVGFRHSAETRAKISAAQFGTKRGPLPESTRRKLSERFMGRPLPAETRRKISETKQARYAASKMVPP